MEADHGNASQEPNSIRIGQDHYKITQIDINPDHAELQSFVPDVNNGTKIRIVGAPSSTYIWQEGMKFIIDDFDGNIKYVPKDWSTLVGVGKPLPQFQRIKLEQSAEQINNAILVCFYDMEQRPSRNCINQLAKQANQLKKKGLTVIAVQASKINENALNKWMKDNSIPFPVGMIQSDEEKIRFTWGVKSLPWLILTDTKHIIQAEGLNLSELDKKIELAQK